MLRRCLAVSLGLAALTLVMALRADDATKSNSTDLDKKAADIRDRLKKEEQELSGRFSEFRSSLLALKQRLEKSPRPEDQERAKILQKALEQAQDKGIGIQFEKLVEQLKIQKLDNLGDIKEAMEQSKRLATDLRELLNLLREDTRANKLREERLRLEELLRNLEKLIQDQKLVRALTDANKTDKGTLQGAQAKVTEATGKLANKLGDAKGDKGDKGGEGKKGDGKGDKGSEGKKGDGKGDKGGEGKKSDAKGGDKSGGKGGEKSGDDKKGGAKDGGKGDKGSEGKKADAKGDKSGEGKPASGSKGDKGEKGEKGGAKGGKEGGKEASKGGGKGDPKEGGKGSKGGESQAKGGEGKPGEQGDSKGDKSPPPGPQQPQDDTAHAKKKLQDAGGHQSEAEKKIGQGNNPDAAKDEDKAIKEMNEAKKKLEELLRQIREEELERLLAALQGRCQRMLDMQIAVQSGTVKVEKAILTNADKKANRENSQESLKLSDKEKEIVLEASKAIELLEAEGSAVAFHEVFLQVRTDMMNVQRRLGGVDVGAVTQAIEQDIIDTLKEMIEALKKARQENDSKKNPPPGQPPPQGPPPDQKLLDQIAELKMIKSMQLQVNRRTKTYGQQYQGEQAAVPEIRGELRQLSDRQDRIVDVTNKIYKGENK